MPTKCRTDESKSSWIHHMQWLKGAFRIPPIHTKERANTCHPYSQTNTHTAATTSTNSEQIHPMKKNVQFNCGVYNNKFIEQILSFVSKADQVSAMAANLASSLCFKDDEGGCGWGNEEAASEKNLVVSLRRAWKWWMEMRLRFRRWLEAMAIAMVPSSKSSSLFLNCWTLQLGRSPWLEPLGAPVLIRPWKTGWFSLIFKNIENLILKLV